MIAVGSPDTKHPPRGALSLPDSVKATLDTAHLTIDYSRPAVKGGTMWGGVVPWEGVWQLAADMATYFTADVDLRTGDGLM